jgi:hypothetical protein
MEGRKDGFSDATFQLSTFRFLGEDLQPVPSGAAS